jgi:hypothetical protein
MDITAFKETFNGGTRGNRFRVTGAIGDDPSDTHSFHIRSTFIPAVPQMVLEMNAFGRKLHIPGDREYGPWQVTIYDDIEYSSAGNSNTNNPPKNLWSLFSDWQESINSHAVNNTTIPAPYLNYKKDWIVEHLDLNGSSNPLKKFVLKGCWPSRVGDIDFNMTRRNFITTFSVVMIYDEIRIKDVHTGV